MLCWTPADLSASADRFTQDTCSARFTSVVKGLASAEELGISEVGQAAPAPTGNDTGSAGPFGVAMSVLADQPAPPMPEVEMPKSPAGRVLTTLYFQMALAAITLAIAFVFGRAAQAHSCFLNAAWRNAVMGEGVTSATAGEGEGTLLTKTSGIVARRLRQLTSSRSLAVGYLVFQLIVLVVWFGLAMAMYHGSEKLTDMVDDVADMKVKLRAQMEEMMRMKMAAIAAGQVPPPPPPQYSGNFLCDFSVSTSGQTEDHSMTCAYTVAREAASMPTPPMDPTPLLMTWHQLLRLDMALCLTLAAILAVHILAVFLLQPLSRRRSLGLVLTQMGVKPRYLELSFCLSDVAFVASFSKLGAQTVYLMNASPTPADTHLAELNGTLNGSANPPPDTDAEGEKEV